MDIGVTTVVKNLCLHNTSDKCSIKYNLVRKAGQYPPDYVEATYDRQYIRLTRQQQQHDCVKVASPSGTSLARPYRLDLRIPRLSDKQYNVPGLACTQPNDQLTEKDIIEHYYFLYYTVQHHFSLTSILI